MLTYLFYFYILILVRICVFLYQNINYKIQYRFNFGLRYFLLGFSLKNKHRIYVYLVPFVRIVIYSQ